MSPTEYLTPAGLQALIRDPKSVRNWPEQRMPGFPADQMNDREIDLVISYLAHMTRGAQRHNGAIAKPLAQEGMSRAL
jgi:mono/diheme cytochrome c family protein